MKAVLLEGVLMNNDEFISCGKSMFLTKEMIENHIKIVRVIK